MTRPSAQVLLNKEFTEETGCEILAAKGLYAVLYKLQPINVKLKYYCISGPINKYTKSVYPNLKPAENLAAKLNAEFNTTDFSVKRVL